MLSLFFSGERSFWGERDLEGDGLSFSSERERSLYKKKYINKIQPWQQLTVSKTFSRTWNGNVSWSDESGTCCVIEYVLAI